MFPKAVKFPSSTYFNWKNGTGSRGLSRLYLTAQYYGTGRKVCYRGLKNGRGYRYYSECVDREMSKLKMPPCPPPQKSISTFPLLLRTSRRGVHSGPPPNKNYGFRATFAVLGLGTVAVVAYAKYDPEFREYIEENAPAFNEFIKITTQEERSYSESWEDFVNYLQSWWSGLFGESTKPKTGSKEPVCPPPEVPKYDEQKVKQPAAIETKPAEAIKPSQTVKPAPPAQPVKPVGDTAKPQILEDLPEFHPKNMVELETSIGSAVGIAVTSYNKAVCALRDHTADIYSLIEKSIDRATPELWAKLKVKAEAKEKTVKEAETAAGQALLKAQRLQEILNDPQFEAPESIKEHARENVKKMMKDIEVAKLELEAERERGAITDRYWQKVEEARRHFKDEIEILFPSVRIDDRKLNIREGEFDLFILHAFQHVLYYQKELSKLETLGELRIKQALAKQGSELNESAVQAKVQAEIEKQKRFLTDELEKKLLSVRSEQEREIKTQMKRQIEAYSDHMADMLKVKELEGERKARRIIDEKVEAEKNQYKLKLAEMVGRLQGMEAALKERAEADRSAHQAHTLFSACQSLFRALRAGRLGVPYHQQLRPLEPELSAISDASGGRDALVDAILDSVPPEAKTRGVYPETALRERFLKVESVASKLALVPEQGGSLPRYLLSYLQSFLLFKAVNPIPASELNDNPVNVSKLNTYDILQRARYWLDRGDFTMTLRYMNLLKGAPRSVACDWIKETRILLETQQAANALMAHAAATGLLYLG